MSIPDGHFRVHVRLGALEDRKRFGLHVWGVSAAAPTEWEAPLSNVLDTWFGLAFDVALHPVAVDTNGAPVLALLLHRGEDKRAEIELMPAEVPPAGSEVWLVGKKVSLLPSAPDRASIPAGDLAELGARAHWLNETSIAWRAAKNAPEGSTFFLYASSKGQLTDSGTEGITGYDVTDGPYELKLKSNVLTPELAKESPYLQGCALLQVCGQANSRTLCRKQLCVVVKSDSGDILDCTGVQLSQLIDKVYEYDGPLGCVPSNFYGSESASPSPSTRPRWGGTRKQRTVDLDEPDVPGVVLALWAPTAQEVGVVFYDGAEGPEVEALGMTPCNTGVWRISGPTSWWGRYYTYRVKAYHPQVGQVVMMSVPDPYSVACSANAGRSLATYLPFWNEGLHRCDGLVWQRRPKPELEHRARASVYELHIRDFSAFDETVPEECKGKYLAFELEGTRGDLHLRRLAAAGLTHVQLLPNYDFGTVPERTEDQLVPSIPAGEPPDSDVQQAQLMEVADYDAFNWGYDPVLYNVPEGSYASQPDGFARIVEHRRMVSALHAKGLRVVVDVVYNHTLASGPESPQSVLDKCVPGYYHRRSENGDYENSTCMNNTAAERLMMQRLVVDSILHWTLQYGVDGFRFDLMGHLPLKCMKRVREVLDGLTLEQDGVDGTKVLLYGEGWEFGEISNGQRGVMAVQGNLAGTGIGSFNDRLRDATLGGTPFIDPRTQGFSTGLYLNPWPAEVGVEQGDQEQQFHELLVSSDKIRIGLAGSLKNFVLQEDCNGHSCIVAAEAYGGGVAYTGQPEEIINYVSAHDNETLFDNTAWKMSPEIFFPLQRARANWLCTSIVALSHGVPFFHAGDEILRSKSLDRDSYNSGDWFNVLDYSGQYSAFGSGLPPAVKNGDKWHLMQPLLLDLSVKPHEELILCSIDKFCELLCLRYSTPLFGLVDANDICTKVDFPCCGSHQIPGVIVMQVRNGAACRDPDGPLLCGRYARIVVVFSATFEALRVPVPGEPQYLANLRPRWGGARRKNKILQEEGPPCCQIGMEPLQLHPVQADSEDLRLRTAKVVGDTMFVPPQSAVVFVEPLPGTGA